MESKEILTAPRTDAINPSGVVDKPSVCGAFIFTAMNKFKFGKNNPYYKHGITGTPLYFVWIDMIRRCEKPNRVAYKDYGARGISVCKEWHNPKSFFDWAMTNGYKNSLLLDRVNNNGNYEPGNCRFVTRSISEVNKRKRPDYDIFEKDGVYSIRAKRNRKTYFGGSTTDINKARILRDKLIAKLNSGNYKDGGSNLMDECDKTIVLKDKKTGRYLPVYKKNITKDQT